MRKVLYLLTVLALGTWTLVYAQQSGGAFIPGFDYDISGAWNFSGTKPTLTGGGSVVGTTATQTLTNKTLTSPVLTTPTLGAASATSLALTATTNQLVTGASSNLTTVSFPASSGAVTLTMPNTTDTVVGRATTDTLTNKTIASSSTVPYVAGVAAGYKLARGTITLDGSNPSSAATGLTTVVSCNVSGPAAAAIPGDDPMGATPFINTTNLDIYAWKTDGSDPTPVASTNNTAVFYWVCLGT